MAIKDTLELIAGLAEFYDIDKPYIVGGLPRDLYLNRDVQTSDVDLTTNSSDVLRLGILAADKLNVPFELSDDGHITVFADEFDIDFSSHFISEAVVKYLDGKFNGFEEAFSRDFTINTLHQDLKTGDFFDPTGMAVDDIRNKVIRTPVPAEITLTDDPRRAYRAINLAVRYDFTIDSSIVNFVKENKELFSAEKIKDKYITLKINKALNQDPDKTISLLQALELFKNVPLSGQFKDILIEKKILVDYLSGDDMKKEAKMAYTWNEYAGAGKDQEDIRDFWEGNYQKFTGYDSPSFDSWSKWYMDKFRGEWNGKHKSPFETLSIMKNEAEQADFGYEPVSMQEEAISMPEFSRDDGSYMDVVSIGKYVDVENTSDAVKSFLLELGKKAKELGIETPYVTSGYRNAESQAHLMRRNWVANGGMNGGREYLVKIYNDDYAHAMADVFEKYRGAPSSIKEAMPIVNRYGSNHMKMPARAIDLRITSGIEDAIRAVNATGRFDLKIIDERDTAAPHWHIAVYGDSSLKLASIDRRKEFLNKLTTGYFGKIGNEK